jgi:hypothetical protein
LEGGVGPDPDGDPAPADGTAAGGQGQVRRPLTPPSNGSLACSLTALSNGALPNGSLPNGSLRRALRAPGAGPLEPAGPAASVQRLSPTALFNDLWLAGPPAAPAVAASPRSPRRPPMNYDGTRQFGTIHKFAQTAKIKFDVTSMPAARRRLPFAFCAYCYCYVQLINSKFFLWRFYL